jgi:hypothetical protein
VLTTSEDVACIRSAEVVVITNDRRVHTARGRIARILAAVAEVITEEKAGNVALSGLRIAGLQSVAEVAIAAFNADVLAAGEGITGILGTRILVIAADRRADAARSWIAGVVGAEVEIIAEQE